MSFQSIDFLIFFIIIFVLYWILKRSSVQNILLLTSSYFFISYANKWFGLLLLISNIVNYSISLLISKKKKLRTLLILGVSFNLMLLIYFKYLGFFSENFNDLLLLLKLKPQQLSLNIILPLGISFFTFTNISYLVDVYKNVTKVEKNFINFALYINYFPKLISGPIERSKDFLQQIYRARKIDLHILNSALTRIIWGYFKKLVIADNLAISVNKIFMLENIPIPLIIVGTILFSFQLYADFSAYTDIAIGISRLFGIKLNENFNFPYISRSPSDFWNRWHTTLSKWIRDYIYIPLGGSRKGKNRTYINLIIAFCLSGLWHGASWNFILWGFYWAILVIIEKILKPIFSRINKGFLTNLIGVFITFILINIGWLIFYETDVHYLIKYIEMLNFSVSTFEWKMSLYILLKSFIYIIPFIYYYLCNKFVIKIIKKNDLLLFATQHVINGILILLIIIMSTDVKGDFIYQSF